MTDRETVLVTGGAGFIGSHTCKALAAAGYLPVVFDSLARGNEWAVRYGPLEHGDLNDVAALRAVMRRRAPVGVIHFAAYAYVGESNEKPLDYHWNNVGGTISLLRAMQEEGVGRLVFSSSCATYGVADGAPIREDAPQEPINPYGHSKLMCERIIRDCAGAGWLSAVALRYFNAAGADPDGDLGEEHDPETHLIPLALQAALGVAPPLTVFGSDYPTPDGTCIRDYIHVTDLADAHVRALAFSVRGAGFDAFNLGTGKGLSIREIIDLAEYVTGRPVPHRFSARRPGDPAALVADPARALAGLDWTPRHSDPMRILETAWAWFARNGDGRGAAGARAHAARGGSVRTGRKRKTEQD